MPCFQKTGHILSLCYWILWLCSHIYSSNKCLKIMAVCPAYFGRHNERITDTCRYYCRCRATVLLAVNGLSNNATAKFNHHNGLGIRGQRRTGGTDPIWKQNSPKTLQPSVWKTARCHEVPPLFKLDNAFPIHESEQWKFTWQTGKTQTWSHFKVCYLHTKYMDIKCQKMASLASEKTHIFLILGDKAL